MTDVTRNATAASEPAAQRRPLRLHRDAVSDADETAYARVPAGETAASAGGCAGGIDAHEVLIADRQSDVQVDSGRYRELVRQVLAAEGVPPGTETAVMFVDVEEMTGLNEAHMGHAGPTDVLAFPLDFARSAEHLSERGLSREPALHADAAADALTRSARMSDPFGDHCLGEMPSGGALAGDVVICPAVAASNATAGAGSRPGHDGSVTAEIDLLVVHGVLHLLGMDHAEPAEAAAMRARESQHLSQLWGRS